MILSAIAERLKRRSKDDFRATRLDELGPADLVVSQGVWHHRGCRGVYFKTGGQVMAKTIRPVMDVPAFITNWLDKGKTFEDITDENEITDAETGERLNADELQTWYEDQKQIRRWYEENIGKR
jgi:hypothetical protein